MEKPAFPEPDAEGNYNSPPLAAMRRVWTDYHAGIATVQDIALTLQAVLDFAQLQIDSMLLQVEEGHSDPEDPRFKVILQAFEATQSAVDWMLLELEEPGEGHLDRGLNMAQRATNRIMNSHQAIMDDIAAMGQVSCMFCGRENNRGVEKCSNCGRNLPVAPEEAQRPSFSAVAEDAGAKPAAGPITQNYAVLAGALEAWRAEQIDSDQLMAVIDQLEERLLAHQQANQAHLQALVDYPEESREPFKKAIGATDRALVSSLAATDKMRLAFDKEDDSYLESGLHDFEASSWAMVAAFHMMKEAAESNA